MIKYKTDNGFWIKTSKNYMSRLPYTQLRDKYTGRRAEAVIVFGGLMTYIKARKNPRICNLSYAAL
jgi:hypothetical protein